MRNENDTNPSVSIILPVGVTRTFLNQALWSIVSQTLSNWECLVIIDDADQHNFALPNIIKFDTRFRLVINNSPGIVSALNTAIKLAKANYIARFDADDVMFPDRLRAQVDILNSRKTIMVVGTQVLLIDENNQLLNRQPIFPVDPADINKALFNKNVLAHPSVMFRLSSFNKVGGYRAMFRKSEDYDLWLRLSEYGDICNTRETYLALRKHKSNLSGADTALDGLYSDFAQVSALCRKAGVGELAIPLPTEPTKILKLINEMWASIGQQQNYLRRFKLIRPSLMMNLSKNRFLQYCLKIVDGFNGLNQTNKSESIMWPSIVSKWESQNSAWHA